MKRLWGFNIKVKRRCVSLCLAIWCVLFQFTKQFQWIICAFDNYKVLSPNNKPILWEFWAFIIKHVIVNDLYCSPPLFLHYSTFIFKVLILDDICCSRVIWLGDLNYRIALSYRAAKALVEMQNWRALLENDQACFTCILHNFSR